MKYKLIFTDKYLSEYKRTERVFNLSKTDESEWLQNEDLVKMICSLKAKDYAPFFDHITKGDDFTFSEYNQIILSEEGLVEKGISEQNMCFSLFDDFFQLSKQNFYKLAIQLCEKLIENNNLIKNKFQLNIPNTKYIENIKNQLNKFTKVSKEIISSEDSNCWIHTINNKEFRLNILGSEELQPGRYITKASIKSEGSSFSIGVFEISLQKYNLFYFGYKNWLFIPEQSKAYLLNTKNGEKQKQITWFRENKRNFIDVLIGNYFLNDSHYTINKKSFIIYNLIEGKKQVIKPKKLLDKISWAYKINENTIRLFFNIQNKTICYNFKTDKYFNVKEIINENQYSKIKIILCMNFKIKNNEYITTFLITRDRMKNERILFTETIK